MERRIRSLSRSILFTASILPFLVGCGSDDSPATSGPAAPTCSDHKKNGAETDVDCGGSCGACAEGMTCSKNADCASGHCSAKQLCVECAAAADCPGADTECSTRTCEDSKCGTVFAVDREMCEQTKMCDGKGNCVQCIDGQDCPGIDDECQQRTCNEGACAMAFSPEGTTVRAQVSGDCRISQCDGQGAVASYVDDNDVPTDADACTDDVCQSGAPGHPRSVVGKPCADGKVCDSQGRCAECLDGTTCPGQDTDCQTRTCIAGVCGMDHARFGSVVAAQLAGDCQQAICDGLGGVSLVADNSDLPDDANPCTDDRCNAGVGSNPPRPTSFVCAAGKVCDGASHCVECLTATTCPGKTDECQTQTCIAGACGIHYMPAGTRVSAQISRDCQLRVCDGSGGQVDIADDADVPDDGNECTNDYCSTGVTGHSPRPASQSCGAGHLCDGAGLCVECVRPQDCPGSDDECQQRTCSMHTCGMQYASNGTAVTFQMLRDCRKNVCDGNGAVITIDDDADLPVDADPCTLDHCTAGVPSNPLAPVRTACGASLICDVAGGCVQCIVAADCSPAECTTATCTAGACSTQFTPVGMPAENQNPGDCMKRVCDGAGHVTVAADDTDVPVAGGASCVVGTCTAGVPGTGPAPLGARCSSGGGDRCDASGQCVRTLTVLRVGTGSAALAAAATAVFVETHLMDGTLVAPAVAVPTTASGNNKQLLLSGSGSTSEGLMSRSLDERYVVFTGYAATVGTANLASTTSSSVNRIVARLDANGVLDTSTRMTAAYSGYNVRNPLTIDGTAFWVCGGGTATQGYGGMHYIQFGTTSATTQILSTPYNLRACAIIDSQLYGAGGNSPSLNVLTIGSGLPTTSPLTATSFPGMPTGTGPSPYQFLLYDFNRTVPGLDRLYLADDRATASGGGIQVWNFDGTNWVQGTTITGGLTVGVRALIGELTGPTTVTMYAVTTEAMQNRLIQIVDDGVTTPAATVLATAPTNTAYRGVSFSAH